VGLTDQRQPGEGIPGERGPVFDFGDVTNFHKREEGKKVRIGKGRGKTNIPCGTTPRGRKTAKM